MLKELEKRLDQALEKETPESLNAFLSEQRKGKIRIRHIPSPEEQLAEAVHSNGKLIEEIEILENNAKEDKAHFIWISIILVIFICISVSSLLQLSNDQATFRSINQRTETVCKKASDVMDKASKQKALLLDLKAFRLMTRAEQDIHLKEIKGGRLSK